MHADIVPRIKGNMIIELRCFKHLINSPNRQFSFITFLKFSNKLFFLLLLLRFSNFSHKKSSAFPGMRVFAKCKEETQKFATRKHSKSNNLLVNNFYIYAGACEEINFLFLKGILISEGCRNFYMWLFTLSLISISSLKRIVYQQFIFFVWITIWIIFILL